MKADTFNDELLEYSNSPFLDQSEYFEDGHSIYPFWPTATEDDWLFHSGAYKWRDRDN